MTLAHFHGGEPCQHGCLSYECSVSSGGTTRNKSLNPFGPSLMLTGSITYGSRIESTEFDKIDITSIEPFVEKVEVSADVKGEITIVVHIRDAANKDEAEAIGLREATRVVNVLAVEQGKYVEDPRYVSHSLKDDSPSVGTLLFNLGNSLGIFMKVDDTKKLGQQSWDALKAALIVPKPQGESDYSLLRLTLGSTDVASKFLGLYRMLGHLAGKDNQEKIDQLISKHEPGVAKPISPHTGKHETVYTKLRNEYMHRSGVSLAQVRAGMESHFHGLLTIVQKALKNP